jgi:hypothetical protein
MATLKKRVNFYESEVGQHVKDTLTEMITDEAFNTKPSYSTDTEQYPDNLMPFVDRHMHYLNTHPNVNPEHYISNLRLSTRLRT